MEVLHAHCAGLDIHKDSVVARVRHMAGGKVATLVKTFKTTTQELMTLSGWLAAEGATHIAMEATGVYWKPVWPILSDGEFESVLANAAPVKNVPGRKTAEEVNANVEPFRAAFRMLSTIPGVATLSAQTIVAEIGIDMSRFPTAGHLISWAGLCPKNDESAPASAAPTV